MFMLIEALVIYLTFYAELAQMPIPRRWLLRGVG
jgi:hypothetical protein